jgi:hypothetical protein
VRIPGKTVLDQADEHRNQAADALVPKPEANRVAATKAGRQTFRNKVRSRTSLLSSKWADVVAAWEQDIHRMSFDIDYLRRREQREWRMARRAKCTNSRRSHQALAMALAARREALSPEGGTVAPSRWRAAWRSLLMTWLRREV